MSGKNNIISQLEAEQMTKEIPAFAPGDTVVVQVRVTEGNRERLQAFEGVVIGKRNRGMNSSFTVRKISYGVGVERTFQTFSKLIDSVSVKRRRSEEHTSELQSRPHLVCRLLLEKKKKKKNKKINPKRKDNTEIHI